MRVFVLIKQVPGTSSVKMDETTGTMIRTEKENVINPLDENALEAALSIRRQIPGTRIAALSMGPRPAMGALREALAMGADEAVLLSDRSFAGSDTIATAIALTAGIRHLAGGELHPDDLVLCGERATDGETGQVGPMVAALLEIPVSTYVRDIRPQGRAIEVERVVENGFERVQLTLPAVLTVVKGANQPGFPTLAGKLAAKRAQVMVLGPDELNISRDLLGLDGSPTRVVRVFRPKFSRSTVLHHQDNSGKAADDLIEFLNQRGLDQGR